MASLPRLLPISLVAVGLLAGCSGDVATMFANNGMSTAGVDKPAAIDPVCVALNSRIDALRKEGVSDRAAQAAATGKSSTVSVKRASLAQLAELDKANAEFQAKCSTLGPRAAATPAPAPAAAAPPTANAPARVATAKPTAAAGGSPAQ